MKKTNFLKGLAAVVLGCMFTSCEKEDLTATFQPKPTEITLDVKVVDSADGDVTKQAAITVSGALNSLYQEFEKGFNGGEVTVTATYKNVSNSEKMELPAVKVGGKGKFSIFVVISRGDIKIVKTSETEKDAVESVLAKPTHTHNNLDWWENASDYILKTKVNYTMYDELKCIEGQDVEGASEFIASMVYSNNEEKILDMEVSAWALYRAWYTVYGKVTTYKVSRGDVTLGNIVFDSTYGTVAQYEEKAHPSHAGHYHYGHGHGHGHGDNSNAGGGIILPE